MRNNLGIEAQQYRALIRDNFSDIFDEINLDTIEGDLDAIARSIDDNDMLQSPASSATSNGMSEVDAKIAAAEARTDTKFAEMMGELRLINQRLEHVEGYTRNLRSTVIGTGIAAVALVVGIFGWGSSMFGVGMDAQSIANQSAKNVVEQARPQFDAINARYERLEQQIGVILTAIEDQKKAEPPKTAPNQ